MAIWLDVESGKLSGDGKHESTSFAYGSGPRLWRVTLRADGDRFAHLIVSAPDVECAESEACRIELAPRRSVVSCVPYDGE